VQNFQEVPILKESSNAEGPSAGLRERKRQETRQRITEAGLRLFGANGYEATTLDAIAAEAGISRRTFFHYFKSKDEILLSLQIGLGETLIAALTEENPTDRRPWPAVRKAMRRAVAPYASEDLIVIDRLMRSSEAVQARKQATYAQDEALLFAWLRDRWPLESETALRLVAATAIGISRLALDSWSREGGTRTLTAVLDEVLETVASVFEQD
jgi:AcrR family transcriptional regulator